MGFSVGGEYTGVVAYLLEGAPPHRRGLIASIGLGGERNRRFARGRRLGPDGRLDERGRPCQLGLANPVPGRRRARGKRVDRPLDDGGIARIPPPASGRAPCPHSPLRHSLANHRGAIARAFAISALGSITYYVGITYVPAFLTSAGKLSESASLWLSTAAAVVVILVTPLHRPAVRPDRPQAGPRPARLGNVVLPITMFALMASGSHGQALARRTGPRRARRRSQRGRRGRDRRAIPWRRPRHRPGARRDHGDRDLRRPDARGSRNC